MININFSYCFKNISRTIFALRAFSTFSKFNCYIKKLWIYICCKSLVTPTYIYSSTSSKQCQQL